MSTFNQFKNTTEILKKYLQKMHIITECDIKPQWIQQNFLKENNPHIFLQLLHYIFIKFSPFVVFVKILDHYPTIKDDNDKKFVTNAMAFGRKMFAIDGKIDVDQFLSQKFVQKKTEWLSQFCKAVYEWHLKESKIGSQNKTTSSNLLGKKDNQSSISNNVPSKFSNFKANDYDSDDEMPRNLNIAPSSTKRPIISKQKVEESSQDEDLKQLMTKKKEISKIKERTINNSLKGKKQSQFKGETIGNDNSKRGGNVFPKNIERDEDQVTQQNQFLSMNKQNKKSLLKNNDLNNYTQQHNKQIFQQKQRALNLQSNYHQPQVQNPQYVTREQFMEIITDMTRNFTQLLTKFNDFQSQVGGWVQNVNAKISILQENVKTIKNNL